MRSILYYVPLRSSMGLVHYNYLNSKLFSVGDYSYYKNNKNAYIGNINKKFINFKSRIQSEQFTYYMYLQLYIVLVLKDFLGKYILNKRLIISNKVIISFFIGFVNKIIKVNKVMLISDLKKKLFSTIKVLCNELFGDSSLRNLKNNNLFLFKSKLVGKLDLLSYFYLIRYNWDLSWNLLSDNQNRNKFQLGQYNFYDLSKIIFWNWNFQVYNNINYIIFW